mmetsp:Transcript_704/g.1364  ORF Transcript_704/g.1364 Transcript_704/m.1364 type:complete len:89 (+) Transcript_704:404-670(+)
MNEVWALGSWQYEINIVCPVHAVFALHGIDHDSNSPVSMSSVPNVAVQHGVIAPERLSHKHFVPFGPNCHVNVAVHKRDLVNFRPPES